MVTQPDHPNTGPYPFKTGLFVRFLNVVWFSESGFWMLTVVHAIIAELLFFIG
jgi:hypothetical protein